MLVLRERTPHPRKKYKYPKFRSTHTCAKNRFIVSYYIYFYELWIIFLNILRIKIRGFGVLLVEAIIKNFTVNNKLFIATICIQLFGSNNHSLKRNHIKFPSNIIYRSINTPSLIVEIHYIFMYMQLPHELHVLGKFVCSTSESMFIVYIK